MLTIILVCRIVFGVFYFGRNIKRLLGAGGLRVTTRVMGRVLAVIAVQFRIDGFLSIKEHFYPTTKSDKLQPI